MSLKVNSIALNPGGAHPFRTLSARADHSTCCIIDISRNNNAQENFSTEQPSPRQDARVSEPHEDRRRPGRPFPPPRHRPQKADRQLGEVAGIPGFPKSARLLRASDFRRVYDQGTRYTCPLFAAFSLLESTAPAGPRVGFTTPKALGKAVVRNRIKRRMREAVRLELESLSPEWSIVFNPRRKAQNCLFTELQAEVRRLFIRCANSSSSASSLSLPGTNA
jgi:ribonuclease P protein component